MKNAYVNLSMAKAAYWQHPYDGRPANIRITAITAADVRRAASFYFGDASATWGFGGLDQFSFLVLQSFYYFGLLDLFTYVPVWLEKLQQLNTIEMEKFGITCLSVAINSYFGSFAILLELGRQDDLARFYDSIGWKWDDTRTDDSMYGWIERSKDAYDQVQSG